MDTRNGERSDAFGGRERVRRPIRNKKYPKKIFGEDKRPPKRLFTPEIKRFLKDWLVRRRENPYPNRDEKKILAVQTGLTYIQVCNWFANWRRKLKNAGKEPQRKTWGDLIKTYNTQVQGNVEHFSICSEDSIWEEPETEESASNYSDNKSDIKNFPEHNSPLNNNNNNNNDDDAEDQCYFISSTTPENETTHDELNPFAQAKYKNHIMEKYLKDCQNPDCKSNASDKSSSSPSVVSKWLESAVNFKPSESNYMHWTFSSTSSEMCNRNCNGKFSVAGKSGWKKKKGHGLVDMPVVHGREELDAAEALTRLANNFRSLVNSEK